MMVNDNTGRNRTQRPSFSCFNLFLFLNVVSSFTAPPSLLIRSTITSPFYVNEESGKSDVISTVSQNGLPFVKSPSAHSKSSHVLQMVRNRGLEIREEGATPLAGGMTLYLKAGPDGTSVGDCPFAHYVRIVLAEKNLEYDLRPSTQETKPQWLIDYYEGSMPALRHRKECYTESDVIAQYLDFFFQDPPLSGKKRLMAEAQEAVDGFFPAVARYLKHTPDGDEEDEELKGNLEDVLGRVEAHLTKEGKERNGPFMVGDGADFTLVDAALAPKLFHMQVGLKDFKGGAINMAEQFPAVQAYMDAVFDRPSFKESLYPEETVVWGWSNAREG